MKDAKKAGVFEVVHRYWQAANEYVIQAAAGYHIPVARVCAAFMGPNGDEDPMDKGLVVDGFHPTEQGAELIADMFRKLGYEYDSKP